MTLGWLIHLAIAIGTAIAEKIKTPDVETFRTEGIAPRKAVETMRNGQR
jgi:hypothetical protein